MAELSLPAESRGIPRLLELRTVLFTGVLLMTLFLVFFPVLLLVFYSFNIAHPAAPVELGLAAWSRVLGEPAIWGSLVNTIKLMAAIHAISFPIAILISWVLARTDLPWRHGFEFMFWISFFMPSLAVVLGWILCLDPEYGLLNEVTTELFGRPLFSIYSFWGIVWAHLVSHSISVKVMLLTPTFRNLDSALEEASRTVGAGRFTTLLRIVLPVSLPALLAVLLMAMIRAMQSFEIELVLGPPFHFYVYSTLVYSQIGQEPPDFASASALATLGLAMIIPLILLQRWLASRRSHAVISGRMQVQPVRLGRWRSPIFAAMLLVVLTLTFLPLCFLGLASSMKLFGFFGIPEPWTAEHWHTVFTDEFFRQAAFNTVTLAGGVALLAVMLLSLIAYFCVRSSYRLRGLLDFTAWLPYAVPGILFGLGLLFVFLESPLFRPLYGSMLLLILACVISGMTFGTQILKNNMQQLGSELEEASRVAGASWWQSFTGIVLPIMVPALLLVGITSFISAARDVASVALVATAGTKTLSLLQLDYMVQGRYGAAAVISFTVIVMSTGIALLARALGLRIGIRT